MLDRSRQSTSALGFWYILCLSGCHELRVRRTAQRQVTNYLSNKKSGSQEWDFFPETKKTKEVDTFLSGH